MFTLFGTFGSFLRNLFVLSFASVWGLSSIAVDLHRIADLPWASAGGRLLEMGLLGVAVFAGFVGLVLYVRDGGRKSLSAAAKSSEPEFNPDEIIARHLARRANLEVPPVGGFGRRMR